MNKLFKFNFNERVKVKLTDIGIAILKQNHEDLDKHIRNRGGKGLRPFEIRTDQEGYSSFQLWSLMQTFGPYMILGYDAPFEGGDMIFCGGEEIPKPS